jgi:Tfp pilus assembly protein PilO
MKKAAAGRRNRFDLRKDVWTVVGLLGALLLLNIGFYMFLNLPRLKALSDLAAGRDEVRRTLIDIKASCQAMQDLVDRYDHETTRLDQFYAEKLGTQLERMTRIQQALRAIATEFRIDPESIDYNTADIEDSDLVRFQVTLPLVGGYPNLRHFINRVETTPYLAIIDSVELAGSREGGAMLSLTIRISTYFRGPERREGEKPGRKGAPA